VLVSACGWDAALAFRTPVDHGVTDSE